MEIKFFHSYLSKFFLQLFPSKIVFPNNFMNRWIGNKDQSEANHVTDKVKFFFCWKNSFSVSLKSCSYSSSRFVGCNNLFVSFSANPFFRLFAQWLNERLWERTVSYDGTNSKCLKVRSKSLNKIAGHTIEIFK